MFGMEGWGEGTKLGGEALVLGVQGIYTWLPRSLGFPRQVFVSPLAKRMAVFERGATTFYGKYLCFLPQKSVLPAPNQEYFPR